MIEDLIKEAAVSALISGLITAFGIGHLQRYLDVRRKQSEELASKRRQERRRADELEYQRRRAAGRMFFWLHDAAVKGVEHANGDLEKAFTTYNAVEEEQKNFERMLLAEHQDENRRG